MMHNKGNKMAYNMKQTDTAGTGFYVVPAEYIAHIEVTYGDRVQIVHTTEGNVLRSSLIFADTATIAEYEADPKVSEQRVLRDEFNAANGITAIRGNAA
jgi:hypothetical protein